MPAFEAATGVFAVEVGRRTRICKTQGVIEGVHADEIWFDPATGKQTLSCPWLEKLPGQDKYTCAIYFDRPDECKHYPITVEEMIRDGCEMLEPADLKRPQKAQAALDRLMADSRPPVSRRN